MTVKKIIEILNSVNLPDTGSYSTRLRSPILGAG